VVIHIIFLHDQGSSNPGGIKTFKKIFGRIQIKIDFFFFFFLRIRIIYIILTDEDIFGDDENFIKSNVVETPVHIQPE